MFTPWDWGVLVLYLAGTTWLADRLAGKGQTIRDFFLGGRQLPWPAVCGSIIASEISGVTFVSVPAFAYAAGGNYTYLMLAIGSILARFVIGIWFVPAYYRKEIYSPYEFMGQRLGPTVDRVCTGIFLLGGFLAQGSRLFLAALVLDAITGMGIPWAVLSIALVSVVWTWLGGINSVVWTDVVQFGILILGGLVALVAVILAVPGGVPKIIELGRAGEKFTLWNFSFDRTMAFTFWCGLGSMFLTLASHGTDQMMAQRLFCCRDERAARKAIIWSSVAVLLIPTVMLSVGVGIYAYFRVFPEKLTPWAPRVKEWRDYIFPAFILTAMPMGVKGLLFAAVFSAATATSTLAAMAQTALSAFYVPLRRSPPRDKELIFVSRILVVVAAAGLSLVAILCRFMRQIYPGIMDLALGMAGYTYGAMLGILLLALLPLKRDARGLVWSVPFSILTVFALNWNHTAWGLYITAAAVTVAAAAPVPLLRGEYGRIVWVLLGAGIVLAAALLRIPQDGLDHPLKLAFPWHFPIGTAITLGFGYLLGRNTHGVPQAHPA